MIEKVKNISYEEYKTLVEQAPIMIWRADTNAKCDYFNDTWLAFTGRTLEEELGDGWATGVHPDDFDRCLNTFLTAFREQKIFEMEYRLKRHDNTDRWIFDRGTPFYSEGVFAGYIGSCVDITERIEAQETLREIQAKELKTLKGLLPICASCKDIRDDKGYWNQIEHYVSSHSEAEFSHGLCPACIQKLHPELYQQICVNSNKWGG